MKKRCFYWIFFMFLGVMLALTFAMPFAAAAEFTKKPVASTIIREFSTPAVFNFTFINRLPINDSFFIDTLLGYNINPTGPIMVPANSEQSLLVKMYFPKKMREQYTGSYFYSYYVKSQHTFLTDDNIKIRIASFDNAVSVKMPNSMTMDDKTLVLEIENKEDIVLDINLEASSELFSEDTNVSLSPYEKKNISIELVKEKIWKPAGKYDVKLYLGAEDYTKKIEKEIMLLPKEDVKTEEKKINLLFYRKTTIKKTNIGNVAENVSISFTKTAFAKAFTYFNEEPAVSEENNKFVFKWEKELGLGESIVVESTTNYSVPLAIIVVLLAFSTIYILGTKHNFIIRKKAIKVRTTTGDFAVKIVLFVRNKGDEATSITLTDYLPVFAELYEKHGITMPDIIKKDRLVWKIDGLRHGEEKIYSYIIYTKIKILGRMTLPRATALYTCKEKQKQASSNEVHIIS